MATASAFGFSGWDPIGSFGESSLNSAFASRNAKDANDMAMDNLREQLKLQYQYANAYSVNSPSWRVEGLRKAGLNPILAAGNSSPILPSVSPVQTSIPTLPSNSHGGFDNSAFQLAKLAKKQAKANLDLTNSQAEATRRNAVANEWQMYDAKSVGAAGFSVQVLGKGFGGGADKKVIHTLRVNKVTGEAYDALSGQRVRVIGEVPLNSAKQASGNNYYQYNNYYDKIRETGDWYKPNIPDLPNLK